MTTMKGKEEPEATSIPSAGLPSYASSAQLYCAICTNEILPAPGVVPGVVAEEKKQQLGEEGEVLPRMSRSTMRECCGRAVCGDCVDANPRFAAYCPFCQSLPAKAKVEAAPTTTSFRPLPPPYTPTPASDPPPPPPSYPSGSGRSSGAVVHHYIRPTDSLLSISVLYNLPAQTLRLHNRLYSDHLLHARRTLEIPHPYSGPSLSHPPTEEEAAEEARKSAVKRFQVRTKCTDWEAAEVYLKEAGWDEAAALRRWEADERGKRWGLRAFGY
ncbi:uncharacterized protein H6S33_005913 [Morchella sextelata]|uniref:uncharacterized protein n=1 Tax=Morchella sextelata TaxID=1174677 RepID=UPI001D037440|nr:uncharacterized protein H6S33_005913 [Morchella sextelata]KAH0614027.1 hypothetical protein H6S33_005913 [Morchella sextelata]